MEILISIVIGLGFGSFASVLIHRLHTHEKGILMGRSKCPKCEKTLGALQLIPVVSYLVQKAKCAFCKEPISFRYPMLEITMATFFGLTTFLAGIESLPWLLYYLFLTFIFVTISFYDLWFKEIPDELSLPTIVIAGIVGHLSGQMPVKELWVGFAIPVIFFGGLFLGSRGRWLGGGDVRIGGIMGFVLGYPIILVGLFLSYLIGAVFSVIGLATKQIQRKSAIPFGPFLFIGTYIALFWGEELVNWYLTIGY